MRTTLELTSRGRVCLVLLHLSAGAAWLTGDDDARLAASMLAAPVLIDFLHKKTRKPRLGIRVGQRRTQARASFLEELELENLSPRAALHGLVIHEPRTNTIAGGCYVPVLGPGETTRVRLAARARRRGITRERTFTIASEHPLGMFRWRAAATRPAPMIVEPARTDLPFDTLRAIAAEHLENHSSTDLERLEYFSLREYRDGEDARHVQAARSASLGSLVTKTYRGQQEPESALVLDLRRAPGVPHRLNNHGFERHLSVTATLVEALVERGATVRCWVIGESVEQHAVASPADSQEFMTLLARAQTVAYRSLPREVLLELPDAAMCFWIAAGDHRIRVDGLAGSWHLVQEAAS